MEVCKIQITYPIRGKVLHNVYITRSEEEFIEVFKEVEKHKHRKGFKLKIEYENKG